LAVSFGSSVGFDGGLVASILIHRRFFYLLDDSILDTNDVVYIQAKRWDGHNVGSQDLRGFVGALSGRKANKGVFITTASFTPDAKSYVKDVQHKIVLIDGEQLAQLMIDNEIGVTTSRKYEVKRIDNDYFEGT
jgi:restriction endonuclease Mrr